MMNNVKKNDWIAINLNAPDNISIEDLYDYGITPDNTGLQSEDYYKTLKQVQNTDLFKNTDGSFNDEKFHIFYESALRSYNQYQNINYTQALLDNIETSPYDVFALGDGKKVMDTSVLISKNRDINRTTHGLGNLFETGKPVFDVREVAQANKMRDENGNILDWTPNDKGGFLKGLFRPSAALAIYDEDGPHLENGIEVPHRKGDYKLDENGDPYYELLKNKEMYGRETLRYWDTLTDDDSAWNKIDFMDSDGLHKSIGGTIMRTATTLGLYFIPGVGQYLGWIGAGLALSRTLPVLAKGINGIISSNDSTFGETMTEIENWADRFGYSQSRDVQGKFLSFENIGDIISSSAGQLFQQRMIADIPRKFITAKDALSASKIGRAMSLAYMASTSATDTYSQFKEAGANDSTAGIATLAVTAGLFGLMNINYFKDWLFTNTWLDEDYALRYTMNDLIDANTLNSFKVFEETMKKPMSEMARRMERIKFFKTIHDKTQTAAKKFVNFAKVSRPTEHAIDASEKGITAGQRASLYLSRMLNEGFEETLEEVGADVAKGVTIALNDLGVNVTENDKELDFGLTGRDMLSRYFSAFIGGAIGGAVFEGFNHWEGGPYDSLMEKSLGERLLWYERNGYGKEVRARVDKLYKQGKLGNKNLSAKPIKTRSLDGKNILVYSQGDENDNQNTFVYNQINAYLDKLDAAIARQDLYSNSAIYKSIVEKLQEKRTEKPDSDETAEQKMFHFLEDLDTAKVLTLQEIGFLSVVKEDADRLSLEILQLDQKIEELKNKIRRENNITDANKSKEDELFKNNLYLKDLEKELKYKKEAFEAIANGERNGYYMGLAHVKTNPIYKNIYFDTDDSFSKNLQEGFVNIGVENYTLQTRGLNYNEITDEDLKERIDSEYSALQDVNSEDIDRKLYDYHIRFATKFNPDIEAANAVLAGKQVIFAPDLFVDFAKRYADSINDPIIKKAALELETDLSELKDDDSVEAAIRRRDRISIAIEQMFQSIPGLNREQDLLNFLSGLNNEVTSGNYYSDISLFREMIIRKLVNAAKGRIKKENDAKVGIDSKLEAIRAKTISDIKASEGSIKQFIDTLSDDEIEDNNLSAYVSELDKPIDERDDEVIMSGSDAIEQVVFDKYGLLGGKTVAKQTLNDKIDALYFAIIANSENISDIYEDLIQYVANNTGISESDAKRFVDESLFPGTNLVEYTIAEQTKFDPASKLVEQLLDKFQMYSGTNLFNAIRLLRDREVLKARLAKKDEFGLTDSEERQLQMALSALRVISATINGSLDGLNEEMNISSEFKFVVTPEKLALIYDNQIKSLIFRIDSLLNLSRENKRRTAKAQQETLIEITKKRVESLKDLGTIDFDGIVLDFNALTEQLDLSEATLSTAETWAEKYLAFETELSKQLHDIFVKYKQNNNVDKFVEKIISKLGTEVYSLDPGVIDNDQNTKITPYGNLGYLITRTILDADKFASLWKTSIKNRPDLIPLYSHEYCVYENVASIIDDYEGFGLWESVNKQLKKWPESKIIPERHKTYVNNREIAKHFNNTDGIGGVGKTAGVGYFTDNIIKLLYKDVSSTASGATEDAALGLHESLQLSDDNKPAVDFTKIFDLVSTKESKNGVKETLFKLEDLFNIDGGSVTIKRDAMDAALAKIDPSKVNSIFNSDKGLRILHFDETGLINIEQALFLMELADKFKFFISGYGDSLQNKALLGTGATSGIEDLIHHKTPALTISMRSQCSGITENMRTLQEILREVQKIRNNDPGATPSEHDNRLQEILDKNLSSGKIGLSYDENTYSGTWLIDNADLEIVKKMINFVKSFNTRDAEEINQNPRKKHKIVIVTDSDEKTNSYKNKLSNDLDVIEFKTAKTVQGKEFDFVFVDKSFKEGKGVKFLNLTDFYTMASRAKIGACIVDSDHVISDLGFTNSKKSSAAESTFGSTPEQRIAIYKDYTDWRFGLMKNVPDFVKSDSTVKPMPQQSNSGNAQKVVHVEEEIEQFVPESIIINGVDEETEISLRTNPDLKQHYIDKLRTQELDSFDHENLLARDAAKTTGRNNYSDFDDFVTTLKDLNTPIESLIGSITEDVNLNDDQKMAYRGFISTVARAFLNNTENENRFNFINAASSILEKMLNRAGLDTNIIIDLSLSLQENNGIFLIKEGWIYYNFNSGNKRFNIPISLNTNFEDGAYKNITFELTAPSIKISTNGETMLLFKDVFSEIDGLVLDENGNPYLGVVYNSSDLREEETALVKNISDGNIDADSETLTAINFLYNQDGKTFATVYSGSDVYDLGLGFFSIQRDEKDRIISTTKQRYNRNFRSTSTQIGVQEIISFDNWLRAISIISKLVYDGEYASDADREFANRFFGEDPITAIGKPLANDVNEKESNEHRKNRWRNISKYKILNDGARDGLASALLRYCEQNKESAFSKHFIEGFVKWLGTKSSKDSEDTWYHRKGVGFRFRDDSKQLHLYYILPNDDNSYTVQKWNNGVFEEIKQGNTKLNQLFGPIDDISISRFIELAVEGIDELRSFSENISNYLSSGQASVFPVDAKTETNTDTTLATYSAFETDLLKWMQDNDNSVGYIDTESITEFLKTDSIFKNGLYRNIKGAHSEENTKNGWLKALPRNVNALYTDAWVIQPLYSVSASDRVLETDSQYEAVKNYLETSKNLDSDLPSINANGLYPVKNSDGTITFPFASDVSLEINSAWLKQNCNNIPETISGTFHIIKFDPVKNTISLSEENSEISIKQSGIVSLINNVPQLKKLLELGIIKSNDGKFTISYRFGNPSITINTGISEETHNNAKLVGVDGNNFTYMIDDDEYTVQLDASEVKRYERINYTTVSNRGVYLGKIYDIDDYILFYNLNGNLKAVKDNRQIDVLGINVSNDDVKVIFSTGELFITDPKLITKTKLEFGNESEPTFDNIKVVDHNGIKVIFGNSQFSGKWLKYFTGIEDFDENKQYVLLAIDANRLGIYESNNLDSFFWIDNKQLDLDKFVANNKDTDNWTDPVSKIKSEINEFNELASSIWADYTSNEESDFITFVNNDFIYEHKIPEINNVPANIIRNVYKFLKGNAQDSNISDLVCKYLDGNTLEISYIINDREINTTLSIDKEGRVIKNISNTELNNYKNAIDNLEQLIVSLRNVLDKSILDEETKTNLDIQHSILTQIKQSFDKGVIPNISTNTLTPEQKAIVKACLIAHINKNKC